MRVHSLGLGFVLVCFLFVVCNAEDPTAEIVGAAECVDCQQNNFKTSQAFSGLHVTIDCKLKTGEIKRVGDTKLDEVGEFKISLLKEIIQDGERLKKECYAQLHNAAASPCPAHDGLDTMKIIIKSQIQNKIVFTPAKPLRFSTALCTSKFLWPIFEYPPLPKIDPWKKKWPKFTIPPLVNFGQPWILPPPYKLKPKFKSLPPIIPIYKPKPESPIFKPLPPPVPFYKPIPKPLPPIYKPKPKPQMVKPLPPLYKPLPKPPIVKPLPPIYKPKPKPPIVKPLPPIYKPLPKPPIVKPLPPIYKPKPKPPLVKPLPPIYKPKPKPPLVKPLPPVYKPLPKPPVVKPLPPIYKPLPKPPVVEPLPPVVPIYEPPVVTEPLPPLFPLPPIPPIFHKKPCPFTKIPPKFKHPKFGYFPKPPIISNP